MWLIEKNSRSYFFEIERKLKYMKQTLSYLSRHKRFGIILLGIIALNIAYGFDPRFTIINLLWIAISIIKIDKI